MIVDHINTCLCTDLYSVHESVAQWYMHLLEYCIHPKYGIDIPKINELVLDPLRGILIGGEDVIAQHGAAHWIYFLVRGSYESGYTELFKYMYKYFLDIFTHLNLENEE